MVHFEPLELAIDITAWTVAVTAVVGVITLGYRGLSKVLFNNRDLERLRLMEVWKVQQEEYAEFQHNTEKRFNELRTQVLTQERQSLELEKRVTIGEYQVRQYIQELGRHGRWSVPQKNERDEV